MKRVLFLFIILGLISCKKERTESSIVIEKTREIKSKNEVIKRRDFPFKDLSKVEVLSYEDRMRWDRKSTEEKSNKYTKDLVVNYKLNFDSTQVKERVVLNSVLKSELLEFMSQHSCKIQELPADCYYATTYDTFQRSKKQNNWL